MGEAGRPSKGVHFLKSAFLLGKGEPRERAIVLDGERPIGGENRVFPSYGAALAAR